MVEIDRESLELLVEGTRRFNAENHSSSYGDFRAAIREAEDALEHEEDNDE